MKKLLVLVVLIMATGGATNAQTTDFFELVKTGTPKSVQAAISNGADIKARDKHGWTPLMWAAGHNPNPEVITTLLKAGADINARDKDGLTPLMWAAYYNPIPEVITTLLKAGADSKARDKNDLTPLMCAAGFNPNPEVITTLLKAGADSKARTAIGSTPLMVAAWFNPNPEVITTLLKAGADINARDKDGGTPLMVAAWFNPNPEVITTLLKAGADAKAKDSEGKTAFDRAQNNEKLKGTDAYWKLKELLAEPTKPLSGASVAQPAGPLPLITVLDFSIENIPKSDGRLIVDLVFSALVSARKYRVLDRGQRDNIFKEVEFSLSLCADEKCQLEIGRLLAADKIVVGSMGKVGQRYILNTKMLDVRTGEALSTASKLFGSLEEMVDGAEEVALTLIED